MYKLCLAAYAEKDFSKAAQLCTESAESKRTRRLKAEADVERWRLEEIRDFRKAGESHYSKYQFDKALQAYQDALVAIKRERETELWAAGQNELGVTHYQIGVRIAGEPALEHLRQADIAFRAALEVRNRDKVPDQWAESYNNLGNILKEQANRSEGQKVIELLEQA